MKIAVDIRAAAGERTGKGWYSFNLLQALLKMDSRNQYLLYTREPIEGFENFPNAKIKRISGRNLFWHMNLYRHLKKEKPDYFFAPASYILPGFLPKEIKSIFTVHDLITFLFPKNHEKRAVITERTFLKKALKNSHKILSVSENTKEDLITKFNTSPEKIEIIPCAASQDFQPQPKENFQDFISKNDIPEKFFLAVGTIIPRKNYCALVKAFAEFQEKHPKHHLIIVGGKAWGYEELRKEINHHNLNNKVQILGYLPTKNLSALYNLATALVFPSLYEGFGIPLLEAMQSGCPVIASSSSSIPEVVGDSALMIDPNNPDSITKAMQKIATDPELSDQLKSKALKQTQKFSWEKSAVKLLKIFNS